MQLRMVAQYSPRVLGMHAMLFVLIVFGQSAVATDLFERSDPLTRVEKKYGIDVVVNDVEFPVHDAFDTPHAGMVVQVGMLSRAPRHHHHGVTRAWTTVKQSSRVGFGAGARQRAREPDLSPADELLEGARDPGGCFGNGSRANGLVDRVDQGTIAARQISLHA